MIPSLYTLPAGRETDALIAEYVMGWQREKVPPDARGNNGGTECLVPPGVHPGAPNAYQWPNVGAIPLWWFAPEWSARLQPAMDLWEALAAAGWQCSLVHKQFKAEPDDRWVFHGVNRRGERFVSFSMHAETRELAIARGALASVLRCAGCEVLVGFQHRPSCGRQGLVTLESVAKS